MDIMSNIFAVVACPHCCCLSLTLEIKKQGWTFKLICTGDIVPVYINVGHIGNGNEELKKFLMLMNHPPPMTEKIIGRHQSSIRV